MAILEFSVHVDASPEDVYRFISDLETHVRWSGGKLITKTSAGPVGPGSRYETHEEGPFGITFKERSEIIAYDENERFAWRAFGPAGTWFDWSFGVLPRDGGTLLTERLDGSHGLLAAVLVRLVFRRQFARSMPEGLAMIKQQIESGQP